MKKFFLFLSCIVGVIQFASAQTIENGVLSGCNSVSGEYIIPDEVVEIADYAFAFGNVTKVIFNSNTTKVGNLAFAYCPKLQEVIFPETCKIESFGQECFSNCEMLKIFHFPKSVKKIGDNFFFLCKSLSDIILPDNLDTIPKHMFQSCESLREISLPISLNVISNNAFAGCKNLDEINIPSVDSIATKAFIGCEALKYIDFPDNLRAIADSAFMRCERIKSLSLPKSLKYVGARITRKCYKLEKFIVDKNNPYFIDLDGVLYSKDKSVLYECPAAYKNDSFVIPNEVKTLYPGCFFECDFIKEVTIPQTIEKIGVQSLCNNGMQRFIFNGNDIYQLIDEGLFCMKGQLPIQLLAYPSKGEKEKFRIPDTASEIASYALVGNNHLKEIFIPTSIELLDTCAIMDMDHLTDIFIAKNTPPTTREGNFSGIRQPDVKCHIPKSSMEKYIVDGLWQYFSLYEDEKVVESANTIDKLSSIIYMSPSDKLYIAHPTHVLIFDSSGHKVFSNKATRSGEVIDLSFLPHGVYIAVDNRGTRYRFIR